MQDLDAEAKYYQRVSKAIREAIEKQGCSQDELAATCEQQFGIPISQTTISKIKRGSGGRISMAYISAICQVLNLDMNDTLSLKSEALQGKMVEPEGKFFRDIKGAFGSDVLIANPAHPAFFGYVDKDYDIFFLSTASIESKMISGSMTLSNEDGEYCKIQLKLHNHPVKKYVGQMWISVPRRACYCTVTSSRLGEQCSFVFHHRPFTQGSLKVRLAVASTVSSGEAQRPTMHRIIICEKGIIDNDEKRAFIATQLLLNSSQIRISERKFNELCQDSALQPLLQALKPRMQSLEPYYTFEEDDIMNLPDCDFPTLINLLARLREKSTAKRYNKIGNEADEWLYQYLYS